MWTKYVEEVATKIIKQLEQGTAPWQKPWRPGELTLPYNALTGKEYRGMNSMWLTMQGRSDPRWMTYNQALEMGGYVRRKEKATKIVYWKTQEERQARDEQGRPIRDENGKPKMVMVALERPRAFYATVFNAEQIEELPPLQPKQIAPEPERHVRAEAILANSGANIKHIEGDRAFYQPSTDSITLPERHQFLSADNYYATALHELGHWTGHPSRLNRDLAHPFGSEGYAREELRAEIASLMLGERMDIGHDPAQHAAYVGSWIKALQEDPREIFRAASAAEKITTYVMGFELEQEREQSYPTPPIVNEQLTSSQKDRTIPQATLHESSKDQATERTYLAVPHHEKEEAKAAAKSAGFRIEWDVEAKLWFAPEGANLSSMEKWRIDSERRRGQTSITESPEVQFSRALKDAGLVVNGLPIMDGKIHRVPVDNDKPGRKSGAYAGHMEGRIPGGYIENFKTGERLNWKAEGRIEQLSLEDRARLTTEAMLRQKQRTAEIQTKHQETAKAAVALWSESPTATANNAYCKVKGIENPNVIGLRIVPNTVSQQAASLGIKIAKTAKEAKALRDANPDARVFKAGDLLIPGYDDKGRLWTLQSVNPAFKSFMKGGRKQGLFTVAGVNPDGKSLTDLLANKNTPLLVTEGYATGDTVAKLTGQPVVVAFDSGNLDAVAKTLREQFPHRIMLIAADNDHNALNEKPYINVGMAKAGAVAQKYGAGVIAPQFKVGEKGSDWNDMRAMKGNEETRKLFTEQLAVAKRDAAIISERLITLARTRDMEARNDPITSADDTEVANERGKAVSMVVSAAEQKDQIRSVSADGILSGKHARPATVTRAGIVHKTENLRDTAKRERQDILNLVQAPKKDSKETEKIVRQPTKQPRSRGFDAGF